FRSVAPDVDAQLVGTGELGAHREAEAVAELGRLAPADVAVRAAALPERHQLVARAAGVVSNYGVCDVDGLLQVPQYPVRRERARLLGALGLPAGEPFAFGFSDLLRHSCSIARLGHACPDRVEQGRERQLRIADQGDLARYRLVDIERVERRMDHPLAGWDGEPEGGGGEAAADAEKQVALVEPLAHAAVDPV